MAHPEKRFPNDDKKAKEAADAALRWLWRLIAEERRDIRLVIVFGLAVGVLSLVVPIAAQSLVNTIAFNSLLQPIVVLTLIVLIMLGLAGILQLIQAAIVETIQQRIFVRIALDLAYRLPRLRIEAHDRNRAPELVNRFFEVLTVQKTAALMLLDGLAVTLQSLIALLLLAFYHPILLAFDVLLMAGILAVVLIPARRAIRTSIQESKYKYKVAAWLEEIARIPFVFKTPQGADHALKHVDQLAQEYLHSRKSHFEVLRAQMTGTLTLQAIASSLLLGIGGFLVIRQQLTLGQLVAAEILVTTVVSGFAKFGKYFESFYDLAAAMDKLGSLFDLELERQTGETATSLALPGSYSLRLEEVTFKYESAPRPSLTRLQLELQPGDKVGIQGLNGSGKSTLFELILGLRTPSSGMVEVNGLDVREVRLDEIRRHVALVKRVEIFDGTILDNIRMGRHEIPIEDVKKALDDVGLLDEISTLPNGLLTDLSAGLSPLSAGQAQRLMLARAIVGKPRLLLLDEAFENIDAANKPVVLRTIFDPAAPWTLLAAAHDAAELASCARVLKLEGGTLRPANGADTQGVQR